MGAVKKQCTGSAGKTMSRITRSSPRERTACSSSKRSHDSDIRPSVLLADLRHIRPLAADELDNAAAHRLLRILDVVVSDASSIHDYSQSGVSLAWCLASVRLKENHGQSHEFSNLCNSFTRFLSEYIYHPLGTKEGVCPSRYQDLFLWLSASVTIRKAFADYEHADFIIKKLFSCLSGVHKNVTV